VAMLNLEAFTSTAEERKSPFLPLNSRQHLQLFGHASWVSPCPLQDEWRAI
jgi:hypothetical protein